MTMTAAARIAAHERSIQIDAKLILQEGFAPGDVERHGAEHASTARGFAEYLAIVAAYGSRPNDAGLGHSYAYLNDGNDIGTDKWNPYRDHYVYTCLLGEWVRQPELSDKGAYARRWFSDEIPCLRASGSTWEARHLVNETVRAEMSAIGIPDSEQLSEFLGSCFMMMGHVMTGSFDEAYLKQLQKVRDAYGPQMDPTLHALLRKQSVFLWSELKKRCTKGERKRPLRSLLRQIGAACGN